MKLLKVKMTKHFSLINATNMVKNLEKKYKCAAAIECQVASYRSIEYWCYIADNINSKYVESWPEVCSWYQDMISRKYPNEEAA